MNALLIHTRTHTHTQGIPLLKDTYQSMVDQGSIDVPRMYGYDAQGMPESEEAAKQVS